MTGYDGISYAVGDRIELNPATDLWMQGAKFGTVIGSSITPRDRVHVVLDAMPGRKMCGAEDLFRKVV